MGRKYRMVRVELTMQVITDDGLTFYSVAGLVEEALTKGNSKDVSVRKFHAMELGDLSDVPDDFGDTPEDPEDRG